MKTKFPLKAEGTCTTPVPCSSSSCVAVGLHVQTEDLGNETLTFTLLSSAQLSHLGHIEGVSWVSGGSK